MSIIKFAGLTIKTEPKYPLTRSRIRKYISDTDEKPDITLDLPDEFLLKKQQENPHLSLSECEYVWLGSELFHKILDKNAFMLHSSAVCTDENGGEAYLFSAPSGTGKSTHTSLWIKAFPEKKFYILNDDKPIIYKKDHYMASGSPFSGSVDLSENRSVRIKGICFLERGSKNEIMRVGNGEAVTMLMDQTIRPKSRERMLSLLDMLDGLLSEVPVFKMRCLPDENAAFTAYSAMSDVK